MITIILAGGKGERMKVNFPKVILKVKNIPMIVRAINNAILLRSEMIFIVLNIDTKEYVKKIIQKYVKNTNIYYIIQNKSTGTADAIRCCIPLLKQIDPFDKITIMSCNQPLTSFYTLNTFVKWKNNNDARILACKFKDPSGFSRIIRDKKLNFVKIKLEKECNNDDLKNPYICANIFMIHNYQILENIDKINNNIIELFNIIKPSVYMLEARFSKELIKIDDVVTLRKINKGFG